VVASRAGWVLALALAAAPGTAWAQRDPAAEARTLFDEGVGFADRERWGEALAYFQRSRALVERPSTVFNIANALVRLGRHREALGAFADYLRLSDPVRDAERRAEALRMRDESQAALATLALTDVAPGAAVRLDGALQPGEGASRELVFDPGAHAVDVTLDAWQPLRFEFTALPGAHLTRSAAMQRGPRTPHPPGAGSVLSSPVFWGVTGGVLVTAAAVLVVVLLAPEPVVYNGSTGVRVEGLRLR
jgi:hypothetical protein